jgi:hypothetical protein
VDGTGRRAARRQRAPQDHRDALDTKPQPLFGVGVAPTGGIPDLADDADPVRAWRAVRDQALGALSNPDTATLPTRTPGGPVPLSDVMDRFGGLDILVHTWDFARAVGDGDDHLDEDLVSHFHAVAREQEEVLRTPWGFKPPVERPAGAEPQTEFLCFPRAAAVALVRAGTEPRGQARRTP